MIQKYQPNLNQIEILKIKEKLSSDDSFRKVFKVDLTDLIIKDGKEKIDPTKYYENHFVYVCSGLTGKGKSIGMQSLARAIFPALKVNNIFFHNQQILDALPTLSRPDVVIRDEHLELAQYGIGSTRIKMQLDVAAQTLRKKCIGFIFVGVDELPLSAVQYYFEAVDMDMKRRLTRFAVKDPETKKYLGAIYVPVMKDDDPFWVTYQQRKEEFMDSIINMDFSKGKPKYQEMIDNIVAKLDLNIYSIKKERRLFIRQCYSNLTNAEIEELSTMLEIQLKNASLQPTDLLLPSESPDSDSEMPETGGDSQEGDAR